MTEANDTLARRNMWVLIAAQAILGAQMPLIFTVGGLAGSTLAPNACWAKSVIPTVNSPDASRRSHSCSGVKRRVLMDISLVISVS